MNVRLAKNRWFVYSAAALVAAVAVLWRTPYSLLLPGQSLDLRHVISVHGRPTPSARIDMTDVTLIPDVPAIELLQALRPGGHVMRTEQVVPSGITVDQYDVLMSEAMRESQLAAVYVAERAAGYSTGPLRQRVVIGRIADGTPAWDVLRAGDEVIALDGHSVNTIEELRALTAARRAGEAVHLTVVRDGKTEQLAVRTLKLAGQTRLGVFLYPDVRFPQPAIPVNFSTGSISGSSGGLMFALDIYRSLRPKPGMEHIAGTGTIDANGNVGPIEGAVQKLEAARRAGATLFIVPQLNYADVKNVTDVRIVPVKTFADALKAAGS